MGDGKDHLAERVQALEERMDQMPALLNQRFDAVDAAIAEQRQFTEFLFEGLQARVGNVETRLNSVETRLDSVETRLEGVEMRLEGVETGLRTVTAGLGRVERKLDQFIDRYPPPPPNTAPPS